MSTHRDSDYSIQYVGVVDDSFGILTRRIKQKPLNSYSSYDHNISAIIKSRKSDELSQAILTDRKITRPKFVIIDKPLLKSHKNSAEINEKIMCVKYEDEEKEQRDDDTLIYSQDSQINPYHDKRIIKSIIMNNIHDLRKEYNFSDESFKNDEEGRTSAISRIEMHTKHYSKQNSPNRESPDNEGKEFYFNSYDNLNEKESGEPNPSKYNEYLINHYSLPKKLAKCTKQSRPRKLLKANLRPRPLETKGVYGWKLK